jgi:2-polyprenyl-3-methyl-5-hydroxy-6-metoxy-1,4-benzoquinol methylase
MEGGPFFHRKRGRRFKVKELFKDIARIVRAHFRHKTTQLDILDIGCASGELLYFLRKDLKTLGKAFGFDCEKELIKSAKERFGGSGIKFFVADAMSFNMHAQFDVITLTSVLSYFDNPYPVISNVIRHLKKGGVAVISGIFNKWDIDVRLCYKMPGEKKWSSGHVINQFPVKSISAFIKKAGCKPVFSEQIMPFELALKKNPIRSWTVNLDGKRYMMNGLQLVYNIQIIRITKL